MKPIRQPICFACVLVWFGGSCYFWGAGDLGAGNSLLFHSVGVLFLDAAAQSYFHRRNTHDHSTSDFRS